MGEEEGAFQLGELRRFSDGEISERGRGVEADILPEYGELFPVNRRGWIWSWSACGQQDEPGSDWIAVGLEVKVKFELTGLAEAINLGPLTPRSTHAVAVE